MPTCTVIKCCRLLLYALKKIEFCILLRPICTVNKASQILALYSLSMIHGLKPNSWTYNFVEVSGHIVESSQTWGFRTQSLHFKLVSNYFCSGVKSVSRGDCPENSASGCTVKNLSTPPTPLGTYTRLNKVLYVLSTSFTCIVNQNLHTPC